MQEVRIPDVNPWYVEGLFSGASHIHGQGLFTACDIARDTAVLRFGGFLFPLGERRSAMIMPSTTMPVSEGVMIAEVAGGKRDLSDYINHSCAPNIGFGDALTIVSARDILAQEELVIDYAMWEADETWVLKQQCNCASDKCRKKITGMDSRDIAPGDWRFNYLSPFLKRRALFRREK